MLCQIRLILNLFDLCELNLICLYLKMKIAFLADKQTTCFATDITLKVEFDPMEPELDLAPK